MNYRMERIERLLNELRYEITRGMLEHEIDETISYTFIVPISQQIKNGIVICKFETRPRPSYEAIALDSYEPKLKIVK